jgi:hypothetical protein
VKNSPISAKKSSKRIFFFFLGGLKILPTISTRFLVLVIFKKQNREFATEYSLSKFLILGKMAKNHHLGPSQVPLGKRIGQLNCQIIN